MISEQPPLPEEMSLDPGLNPEEVAARIPGLTDEERQKAAIAIQVSETV